MPTACDYKMQIQILRPHSTAQLQSKKIQILLIFFLDYHKKYTDFKIFPKDLTTPIQDCTCGPLFEEHHPVS